MRTPRCIDIVKKKIVRKWKMLEAPNDKERFIPYINPIRRHLAMLICRLLFFSTPVPFFESLCFLVFSSPSTFNGVIVSILPHGRNIEMIVGVVVVVIDDSIDCVRSLVVVMPVDASAGMTDYHFDIPDWIR